MVDKAAQPQQGDDAPKGAGAPGSEVEVTPAMVAGVRQEFERMGISSPAFEAGLERMRQLEDQCPSAYAVREVAWHAYLN